MKEIKITGSKIKETLTQIDTIGELGPKERGCLRLLTEKMFSMCRGLLATYAHLNDSGRKCVRLMENERKINQCF
ncbi:MAG: hypothetical protein RSD28_02825 [Lachnospiraceae bacterium]